jgi:hypothetical protein
MQVIGPATEAQVPPVGFVKSILVSLVGQTTCPRLLNTINEFAAADIAATTWGVLMAAL